MRTFRDMPIKQKLTVITMSVTAAALLVSGVGVLISDSLIFRANMQRDIAALSQIVADNIAAAVDFDDPQAATQTLASLKARPHLVSACIYRPDSTLFASYLRAGEKGHCQPAVGADELRFQDEGLSSRRAVMVQDKRQATLVMLTDLDGFYERMRIYGATVALVLLGSCLVAFFLSSRLHTIIAGPISNLAQATRLVSETRDYSIRAQTISQDELGRLGADFNEMLVRIQDQDNELRKALLAQKEALIETQKIRDSLLTTLASIGDAVISTDVDGRVVFINDIARSLLRLSEGYGVGRPLEEVFRIVNEFSREPLESPVTKVLREGRIVAMANHTVLLAADGTEVPIDDSGAPIRNESGRIQGTVLVFRDVTPRRRADETSRLLASIVEHTDDAIFSYDLAGLVTSWNKGAERMYGFTREEMIGRPIASLVAPERTGEISQILEGIERGERIEHHETTRLTKGGGLLTVSETVSPMQDPLGRVSGASTISRDITAQVRAAENLAQLNSDLQRSNRTLALTNQDLERFAFIASHDLQEPLRMITAYSQLLIKSYRGQLDANAGMFVDTIVEGTTRMRELLSDLLAYTEIRGRQDEVPEPVDLNLVLEQVLQNLQQAIDESQAVVTSDRLPTLSAQRGHFQPLFQNLVANAIKYRGEIAPRIHVALEAVDGELQFAVSDNGIGIDPEYHKQIFEVFRRLHGKKIPGTGVGLAICQRVVERYGGRIWVESKEGQGATFRFTLPHIAAQTVGREP